MKTNNDLIYQIFPWMMPAMRTLLISTSVETYILFKIKCLSYTEKLLQAFLLLKFQVELFPNWTKTEIDDHLS